MQDKDGGYCPRCDTVWASPGKCRCEENNKVFKGQLGKFNTEPKEYSKEVIEKYNDAADAVFAGAFEMKICEKIGWSYVLFGVSLYAVKWMTG